MEGCCNDMKIISSNTPQSGLGQFGIVEDIFSFATGLFSKDPQKTEYDRVRQQAWDSLVEMVTIHDEHKASGTLSRSIVQSLIDTLTQLMAGFKKYTDGMLQKYPGDSGWITPRFHDYYDFMGQVKNQWQQELATLPADWGPSGVIDYIQDIFTGNTSDVNLPSFPNTPVTDPYRPTTTTAGFSGTSMLLIGGVVLGLVLMSKKKGRML